MWTASLIATALLLPHPAQDACEHPHTNRAPATAADAAQAQIRWHASPEAARVAARASGKPVLVFQLLGKLDDALC